MVILKLAFGLINIDTVSIFSNSQLKEISNNYEQQIKAYIYLTKLKYNNYWAID